MGDFKNADSRTYGIALFGIGRAGTIHFGNLLQNSRASLLYIVDLDEEKAKQMLKAAHMSDVIVLHPDKKQCVYDDERVEGVLVCSPTFTHEDIVTGALNHGKAVFCEKPISDSIEGIAACYKVAEEKGKPLLCSLNRRFDPSVCSMRDRILAGEIGKVHVIKSCSRDHPLPALHFLATSGGMFHDCAVHDIDMLCWMIGEYPVTVFAQAHTHRQDLAEINDVDTIAIMCKFASGILCSVDLSRHSSYGYDQRVEVLGSEGMLQSENHLPNGVVKYNASGITGACYKYSFPQRYAASYVGAMNHFIDLISGKETEIEVKQHHVVNACKVVSACEESWKKGLPVTLTWD